MWPVVIARLGENGGVCHRDDLDAELMARLTGAPVDTVRSGIRALVRVGLLVEGSIRRRGGAGGYHEAEGWVTPNWRKYNPDAGTVTTVPGETPPNGSPERSDRSRGNARNADASPEGATPPTLAESDRTVPGETPRNAGTYGTNVTYETNERLSSRTREGGESLGSLASSSVSARRYDVGGIARKLGTMNRLGIVNSGHQSVYEQVLARNDDDTIEKALRAAMDWQHPHSGFAKQFDTQWNYSPPEPRQRGGWGSEAITDDEVERGVAELKAIFDGGAS